MKKSLLQFFLLANFPFISGFNKAPIDLTLVGFIQMGDGVGKLGIAMADCLHKDLKINHIDTYKPSFQDVDPEIAKVLRNPDKTPGNVSFFYGILQMGKKFHVNYVPQSHIKLALVTINSTKLPITWVNLLNEKFDAAIVPDEWLINVFISSGVKIPVFCLPHVLPLEDLLIENSVKTTNSKPFKFGCCASFWDAKNQSTLIDAFNEQFGDNPDIELHLQARSNDSDYARKIKNKLKQMKCKTIKIIEKSLSGEEHKSFLKSLDCYVLISKGEGFSITPRESLALGIPTILTNNTAHEVICRTPHVRSVQSLINEKAPYPEYYQLGDCGDYFNCTVKDVREALNEVYTNYPAYLKKAQEGREWVKRYLKENLKSHYLSLVKPKKVILGPDNIIGEDFLMTNSVSLYKKYEDIIS